MTETVKTFCRNCSALCAMELDIEEGRPVRARPDGSVSPYGAYLCPKGMASVEFHNGAENRLWQSLKRTAGGGFEPLDAEAALDAIAVKLTELVERYGPRSVAVYHGTGAYRSVLGGLMERAFVSALGTPNFFSTMTIDQSAKWVTMARMGVMGSGKHAVRDVDVALLAGGNPVVTHQGAPFALAESGAPGRSLEALKAKGGRLILVDPRRTETARYADLLIQPLPGQDAVIFAAIAHAILRDGTHDQDFCDRHCIQLDELRGAVAPFTPELAAARADVPVEQIELAARWLGEAKRPYAGSGTGPSMTTHSNLADNMIEVVNALCGGYRRAGDTVRNPGTLKPKVACEMAASPSRSFEFGPKCVSADIGPLMGEFPSALIPSEILADSPDRIRALIVFGGDPLMAVGDPAKAKPAFEALDLLVSLDCRLNETGRMADYVIASSQPFERHEITVPGDALFPESFAQYTPPVIAKPAAVTHDWVFFWGLAARMGVPLTFKYWTYGLKYEEVPLGLALDMEAPPDPEELCRFLCTESRVPFAALKANPGGVRPPDEARVVEPAPEGWAGRLHLCPPDVAQELAALRNEADETEFPYRLICRRILHALNGAYRHSREAQRRYPVNYAYMNRQDMMESGLTDGDVVEVRSAHGATRTLVRGEDRLRRGVISMSHMFGPLEGSGDPVADRGGNVGQLTSLTEHVQPINFMPRFSAIPVTIRAV